MFVFLAVTLVLERHCFNDKGIQLLMKRYGNSVFGSLGARNT